MRLISWIRPRGSETRVMYSATVTTLLMTKNSDDVGKYYTLLLGELFLQLQVCKMKITHLTPHIYVHIHANILSIMRCAKAHLFL
jgi:hypothetical protein